MAFNIHYDFAPIPLGAAVNSSRFGTARQLFRDQLALAENDRAERALTQESRNRRLSLLANVVDSIAGRDMQSRRIMAEQQATEIQNALANSRFRQQQLEHGDRMRMDQQRIDETEGYHRTLAGQAVQRQNEQILHNQNMESFRRDELKQGQQRIEETQRQNEATRKDKAADNDRAVLNAGIDDDERALQRSERAYEQRVMDADRVVRQLTSMQQVEDPMTGAQIRQAVPTPGREKQYQEAYGMAQARREELERFRQAAAVHRDELSARRRQLYPQVMGPQGQFPSPIAPPTGAPFGANVGMPPMPQNFGNVMKAQTDPPDFLQLTQQAAANMGQMALDRQQMMQQPQPTVQQGAPRTGERTPFPGSDTRVQQATLYMAQLKAQGIDRNTAIQMTQQQFPDVR